MRNRLNVYWHGKRTIARFPVYLWRLALISTGWSDSDLLTDLCSSLTLHESDSMYRHYTVTEFLIEKLVEYIEEELALSGRLYEKKLYNDGLSLS